MKNDKKARVRHVNSYPFSKNAGSPEILDGAKPPNRNLVLGVLAVATVKFLFAPMKDTFSQGVSVFY